MGGATFKNPVETLKTVALNVATGGLYGVAQGAKKAVTTGKILAGASDALASYGPGGSVLTPTVGTKNSLAIQAAIAGGALAAAPAGTGLGTTTTVGAGGVGGTGSGVTATGTGLTTAELGLAGTTAATPGTTAAVAAGSTAAPAAATGGITAGQALLGGTALTAAGTAYNALKNKTPKLPGMPEPDKIDQSALDAANAVQTADAEARRRRASKRQSSVLSNYQGASQVGVSPATLQPAAPRKSVLG